MKKDVNIAVIIGFLIGVVSALIFIKTASFIKEKSTVQVASIISSPTPNPEITKDTLPTLTINSPDNGFFADKEETQIKGETDPNNIVIIENHEKAIILNPEENGQFEENITLKEGGNNIYITSYSISGEKNSKTLSIYYTEEKL